MARLGRQRGWLSAVRMSSEVAAASLLSIFIVWACGCAAPSRAGEMERAAPRTGDFSRIVEAPVISTINIEPLIAGYSVEGRRIEAAIVHDRAHLANSDEKTEVVLFMSGIHGDEPAGNALLARLIAYLSESPSLFRHRTIIVMPDVNPDATAANRRTNVNGVDINRNFPSKNWRTARRSNRHGEEPLSEPEARAIADVIETYQPDRVITFHQPIACIDYDGPEIETADLAFTMSQAIGRALPVRRLGSRPGSLGSYAGVDRGVPTITVELPRGAHRMDESTRWDEYSPMLIAAIEWNARDSGLPAK